MHSFTPKVITLKKWLTSGSTPENNEFNSLRLFKSSQLCTTCVSEPIIKHQIYAQCDPTHNGFFPGFKGSDRQCAWWLN